MQGVVRLGSTMGYLRESIQTQMIRLFDAALEIIFDLGEPSLSDVVTEILEAPCQKS